MRSFHIRESGRGEERIRKTVLPLSQKEKVNCVILSDARKAYPAKNLKCYFRVEILRKQEQEAGLRMTIRGFV